MDHKSFGAVIPTKMSLLRVGRLIKTSPKVIDPSDFQWNSKLRVAAMNVAFLNLQEVIIWRSYLPLSQPDSRRGFWQDTLALEDPKDSLIGVVPY
jgi:hypothetical protein